MRTFPRSKEAAMSTLIILAGVVGFALLLFATTALVILNANEKTFSSVFSVLLVGTVTTLVAVGIPLKKSTIESAFATSVVTDVETGFPPFEVPPSDEGKADHNLMELSRLARPTINVDGKAVVTVQKPTTEAERLAFCRELLQYWLVHIIEELQRGVTKAGFSYGSSMAEVTSPLKMPDSQDYPPDAILAAVSSNRFSDSDYERSRWKHSRVPLPPKAKLRLDSSSRNGGKQSLVVIEKPMFFRIEFAIDPLPYMSQGILPKGLSLNPEVAGHCQTYNFRVAMRATFQRISAGNYRTEEYKDWAKELFAGVAAKLGNESPQH
jgi:hypothetical protein